MRSINRVIIHATATLPGQDIGVEEVNRWHKARGWKGCGYHYLVRLNGTLEAGRALWEVGAHCKGENGDSIGIAYVGGLDDDGNPADTLFGCQRQTIQNLLDSLAVVLHKDLQIFGHRDYNAGKSCPCFDARTVFGICALKDPRQ